MTTIITTGAGAAIPNADTDADANTDTAAAVACCRQAACQSLGQVDDELAREEVERAAQALWDAAALGVQAAAARRGWAHHSFGDLAAAITRLHSDEAGPKTLHWDFILASNYRQDGRMWPMPIDADGVRYGKERVVELLRLLAAMD